MLLNNQQITEEIKICIETNENENTKTQNLWDTVKSSAKAGIFRSSLIAKRMFSPSGPSLEPNMSSK